MELSREITPDSKVSDMTIRDFQAILMAAIQSAQLAAATQWEAMERERAAKVGIVKPIFPSA